MTYVINNAQKAMPDWRIPPVPHETDLGDLRLILLPPGKCELRHKLGVNTFDVNLGQVTHEWALNSDRVAEEVIGAETLAFFPKGSEFFLSVDNPLPGCVLEIGDRKLTEWMDAGEIRSAQAPGYLPYSADGAAAELARSAIRQLMRAARSNTPSDRLTVEALALGIAARGMAQFGALDGDLDAEITRWNRTARRTEISRAIDLIEARLCDSELSISDLADAACLSSSRFSSIFRSMIGETPYAFVLRRRAEFARDLIIGTREPISQIAYDAGFSSQAHMTVVIRRVFGTTPAAMRN